jgi:hypothetical protein
MPITPDFAKLYFGYVLGCVHNVQFSLWACQIPEKNTVTNGTNFITIWKLGSQKHRLDGPAYTIYFEKYAVNGQIEKRNGHYEKYVVNGQLHRNDGPALIWNDLKMWYQYGKLRRTDGPAIMRITSEEHH